MGISWEHNGGIIVLLTTQSIKLAHQNSWTIVKQTYQILRGRYMIMGHRLIDRTTENPTCVGNIVSNWTCFCVPFLACRVTVIKQYLGTVPSWGWCRWTNIYGYNMDCTMVMAPVAWDVAPITITIFWYILWEPPIEIWLNYNISLTWIKAIWEWFPLLTMIIVRSQWGRYNLPRFIDSGLPWMIDLDQYCNTAIGISVIWPPKSESKLFVGGN